MKRDEAVQGIKDMAEHGIVEPPMSPWSSPVVLVTMGQRDSICVHYRRLNDVTRKDSFPLPRVDVHTYIYYSAHSPLGLFSGRLHQVLCLLLT